MTAATATLHPAVEAIVTAAESQKRQRDEQSSADARAALATFERNPPELAKLRAKLEKLSAEETAATAAVERARAARVPIEQQLFDIEQAISTRLHELRIRQLPPHVLADALAQLDQRTKAAAEVSIAVHASVFQVLQPYRRALWSVRDGVADAPDDVAAFVAEALAKADTVQRETIVQEARETRKQQARERVRRILE